MAAIDKLYVHSYYEYDEVRKWAIAYYPELLFYMYRIDLTYKEYLSNRKDWIEQEKEIIKKDLKRFEGNCGSPVNNLIDYYYKTAQYDCPIKQAEEEWNYCQDRLKKLEIGDFALEDDYTIAVMNTPLKVDRKLKWICPIPCVRKYLHKRCGVNPKWEWLYKIFWKGKKHF